MPEPETDIKPRIALLGIPIEIGASQPGTLMGPDALRTAGIGRMLEQLGFAVEDHGDMAPSGMSSAEGSPPANAKYYDEIKGWIRALSERSFLLARSGAIPIFMGGDHSLSMGSVNGVARYWQRARAGRCSCCGSTPMPTTTRRDDGDRQHARHVGRVPVRRARPRPACSARNRAPRSVLKSSICSASARSIRRRRSWCSNAASPSPTCARSTNSASPC